MPGDDFNPRKLKRCSFCGKTSEQVRRMVAGPNVQTIFVFLSIYIFSYLHTYCVYSISVLFFLCKLMIKKVVSK